MTRITIDETMLAVACVLAARSTCARRAVGCVLTDKRGRIISTGYNGVARYEPHCLTEKKCAAFNAPSGTNLDACAAIHAEQNAIVTLRDPDAVETCYVTTSPCTSCVKLLMNTACQRIVFINEYADKNGRALWELSRRWDHYKLIKPINVLDLVMNSIVDRGVFIS